MTGTQPRPAARIGGVAALLHVVLEIVAGIILINGLAGAGDSVEEAAQRVEQHRGSLLLGVCLALFGVIAGLVALSVVRELADSTYSRHVGWPCALVAAAVSVAGIGLLAAATIMERYSSDPVLPLAEGGFTLLTLAGLPLSLAVLGTAHGLDAAHAGGLSELAALLALPLFATGFILGVDDPSVPFVVGQLGWILLMTVLAVKLLLGRDPFAEPTPPAGP